MPTINPRRNPICTYTRRSNGTMCSRSIEIFERDGSHQPRAYYLYLNDRRVEHGQKPWFVTTTNLARQYPPVPILPKPPEPGRNTPDELIRGDQYQPDRLHPVFRACDRSVHITCPTIPIGDVERVALTPLAVSDTTLLGLWLLCVAAANQDDPTFLDSHSGSHGHHGLIHTIRIRPQTTSPTQFHRKNKTRNLPPAKLTAFRDKIASTCAT